MDNILKIAMAQIAPVWLDKLATIEKVEQFIIEAAKEKCELIVFGEGLIPGYPFWLALIGGAEWDKKLNKELHAHYVRNSPNENKMIYTNDRDLLQLISDDTKVYLYGKKAVINIDNFKNYFDYHYGNVGLIKIIAGDSSDNISGLEGIGEETVLKLFPELKKEKKDYDWVIGRVDELLNETPSSKKLQVIKEGKTKWGTYGTDYFGVMNKIINLEQPNVTDELRSAIIEMVNEPLHPDGRGGINKIMEMMKEDELLNFLPKYDDGFFVFWSSFITIVNKEKKFYEQTKK